jgi:hypothetical protein
MSYLLKILSLVLIIVTFSCEKEPLIIKCSDCVSTEPLVANIKAKLSFFPNSNAVVKVYEGYVEDNILYATLYSTAKSANYDECYVDVTINKMYTFVATYSLSTGTYYVTNSTTPRVKYETEQCTDPCYYVYDNEINLRLK